MAKKKIKKIPEEPITGGFNPSDIEFKDIREEEQGIPRYYPTNPYEVVATLGEREYGFKGFTYPQSGNRDNMIVALWKPVPAERLDKSFYNKEEN